MYSSVSWFVCFSPIKMSPFKIVHCGLNIVSRDDLMGLWDISDGKIFCN